MFFKQHFWDSIYIVSAVMLLYAAWILFRLVIFRPVISPKTVSATDRQRAQNIVKEYGHSALARITLLEDKSYYFSPSGQTVIAYVQAGRGVIALGDPIGPLPDQRESLIGFQEFCAKNGWFPAFYQTLPDYLTLYQSLGFHTIKIGEDAIADLPQFTLKGKSGRNLRPALNKFNKQGYRIEYYAPPICDDLIAELKSISDEWLDLVEGAEKKFSMGWFDRDYLRDCEIAVMEDAVGNAVAFANIIPEYQNNEATIDLIRHRRNIESGMMDFFWVSMIQEFKDRHYNGFNLGLVISNIDENPNDPRLNKGIIHYYNKFLIQFYNFEGLRAYKKKFHPDWEPRYFVYSQIAVLPHVIATMAFAHADTDNLRQNKFITQFLGTLLRNGIKQISRFLPSLFSIGLFGLSIWTITSELHKYKLQDILIGIATIPSWKLLLAVVLTILNYVFLTGYDVLAIKLIPYPLPYQKAALVAVISHAIGNSVGCSLLSSSAIRFRFYSNWGLPSGKIAQIIVFTNFSFWIGLLTMSGIMFAIAPLDLPFVNVHLLGLICLAVIIVYLMLSSIKSRSVKVGSLVIPRLPLRMTLAQIFVSSCDWALAAAVLYVLLPTTSDFNYFILCGSYLLAQFLGIVSNVPSGLGVFETVLLFLLSPRIASDLLIEVLLLYRTIYYFLPLIISLLLLAVYEIRNFINKGR